MDKFKPLFLTVFPLCVICYGANAQGLLGDRYAAYNIGYERFDFDDTMKGLRAGFEVNAPIPVNEPDFGLDFNGEADYIRVTGGGDRLEVFDFSGKARGYMPFEETVIPYAEIGVGWMRGRVSGDVDFSGRSVTLPLGVGVEVIYDRITFTPFFEYTAALESDLEDRWSAGARTTYLFPADWGASLTVAHTDWGGDLDSLQATVGVVFPY